MGSLHIDLCTEHCVPVSQLHVPHQKFHLNLFQYSVGDGIMIDAITYGQDCTTLKDCINRAEPWKLMLQDGKA